VHHELYCDVIAVGHVRDDLIGDIGIGLEQVAVGPTRSLLTLPGLQNPGEVSTASGEYSFTMPSRSCLLKVAKRASTNCWAEVWAEGACAQAVTPVASNNATGMAFRNISGLLDLSLGEGGSVSDTIAGKKCGQRPTVCCSFSG
jgi:hypothetical protein